MTTPLSLRALAECNTLAEAKEIGRSLRETAIAVANKYGEHHPEARAFSDRYWTFIDEMTFRFAK